MPTVRYTVINGEVIAEKRGGVRRLYVPDPLGSTVALVGSERRGDTCVARRRQFCVGAVVVSSVAVVCTAFVLRVRHDIMSGQLLTAVRQGDGRRACALLAAGADPDARTSSGWTPLIEAAHRGNVQVARALLAAGADPNVQLPAGLRALGVARGSSCDQMVSLLKRFGARD